MLRVHTTLFLAAMLAACSDDESGSPDLGTPPGNSAFTDTGTAGDAEDNEDFPPLPDIDGDPFVPDVVEGVYYDGDSPLWLLTAKEGGNWLTIENYPNFGGATGPETRVLDADEVSYATCGVCVVLQTGCTPHGDHGHCSKAFMPEAGSRITFETLGEGDGAQWSGSITPIRFIEVTMSGNNSTPVEGGDQIELDTWSFDVTLTEG